MSCHLIIVFSKLLNDDDVVFQYLWIAQKDDHDVVFAAMSIVLNDR